MRMERHGAASAIRDVYEEMETNHGSDKEFPLSFLLTSFFSNPEAYFYAYPLWSKPLGTPQS
jgi:hypothetical protein